MPDDIREVEGVPDRLRAIEYSDQALASDFVELYCDDLRYLVDESEWRRWCKKKCITNGGYSFEFTGWHVSAEAEIYDLVRAFCLEQSCAVKETSKAQKLKMMLASERTVSSVLKLIRGHNRLHSTLGEWDRHPWLLNTPDGVVDLRTGKLREHRRSDFITQSTSVTPHKGCQPVRFLQFLDEITDNDVDLRQFWKRVFGYSLLGANPEHAIFFGFGTGRNGKTVLRKTFAEILHTYHCTAPMEAFTQKRMSQHPTEIADLRGKRLVTAIETEPGTRWNETRLKELSGGDEIATRHMRQDFFRFIPVCKLLFFGNNKPGLKNVDTAIRERFLMLPFPHEFLADDRDKWLYDSLRQEWPGILQWAMKVVWNGSSWEDLIPRQACGVKPKNILRSRIRSGDSSMNVARLSRVRDVSVSSCIQNGGLTATRWEKRRGPPLFFIS